MKVIWKEKQVEYYLGGLGWYLSEYGSIKLKIYIYIYIKLCKLIILT